jgi:hypothetical protein
MNFPILGCDLPLKVRKCPYMPFEKADTRRFSVQPVRKFHGNNFVNIQLCKIVGILLFEG